MSNEFQLTRRQLMGASIAVTLGPLVPELRAATDGRRAASTLGDVEAMTTLLTVNGRAVSLTVDPRMTLLDALREELQLTGSKKGCDQGQCGACTVLVDGRRINACLTLLVMHEGSQVITIEGLGTPEQPSPMQRAFVKHDGFQCGYCTPGQIVSATAVLSEMRQGVPSHVTDVLDEAIVPSDVEIRERLSGNICRCAAYPNIVAAVLDVVESAT